MRNPMRATIVPADQYCAVDGVGFSSVDMTGVAPDVHAVQWHGEQGEVEVMDPVTGKIIRNEVITSLSAYESVLESYWEIRNAFDAEQAALAEEAQIIEV